jgi:hypothetical protein
MTCQGKQEMVKPEKFTAKNGAHMARGDCVKCGRRIVVILPKDATNAAPKKAKAKKAKK